MVGRSLLDVGRPNDSPAALAPDGPRPTGAFRRAVAGVRDQVRTGERVVLACEDAYAFAAGLLGAVLGGARVIIPPNLLPATLACVGAEAVLDDARCLREGAAPASGPLPDTDVEFWTSGSTGTPKAVLRRFHQLAREAELLAALFGEAAGDAPVAATVPPHHIYGCLFRILWPLATGRPFLTAACGDPASFREAMALRPILVASPAHLARLPKLVALDGLDLPAVFSSGGVLEREDALTWRRASRTGVFEVYGSTESGGIAWRNPGPDPASSRWAPFPDTQLGVEADGALHVRSSRVDPGGLRMEDAVRLDPDGTFELLGRLDRTVKIEEKRVSLPQVEAALKACPGVAGAAVVLLEGRRRQLGAAVVLRGALPPDAPARRALGEDLRARLAQTLEAPALPRKWRFVEELPLDARGKLRAEALAALFEPTGPTP